MANDDNVATVSIDVTGSTTDKQWKGDFEVLRSLSYRAQLARDRHRRDLIGAEAGNPDARAISIAYFFAECWVRIVKAPTWWTESGNGINMVDENVVGAVYDAAMAVDILEVKARKKAAEEARKVLEAEAKKKAQEDEAEALAAQKALETKAADKTE